VEASFRYSALARARGQYSSPHAGRFGRHILLGCQRVALMTPAPTMTKYFLHPAACTASIPSHEPVALHCHRASIRRQWALRNFSETNTPQRSRWERLINIWTCTYRCLELSPGKLIAGLGSDQVNALPRRSDDHADANPASAETGPSVLSYGFAQQS
jgi:hypothetical protein